MMRYYPERSEEFNLIQVWSRSIVQTELTQDVSFKSQIKEGRLDNQCLQISAAQINPRDSLTHILRQRSRARDTTANGDMSQFQSGTGASFNTPEILSAYIATHFSIPILPLYSNFIFPISFTIMCCTFFLYPLTEAHCQLLLLR
jgi:hypothetical protein